MKTLQGKTAVLTGAASGFGLELARRCAGLGMRLVMADVQADALARAADAVRGLGAADVLPWTIDIARAEQVEAMGAATLERFGAPHLVFNNAGVGASGLIWEHSRADWEWVLGVNLMGVAHGVRVFTPMMLAAATADPDWQGHIVNTASMAGLAPGVGAPYDASKHAVVALTEDLFLDLQAQLAPVGVSVLCPGWVRTNIVDADRNWPAEHGAVPDRSVTTGAIEHHFRRAIAEGMTPAEVADRVAAAIIENRFWVLPDPAWLDVAADRWDAIRAGADPSRPEQMPGLPPTSRLFEEIVASLLDDADPAG